MKNPQIGDRVAYSAEFCRSTGQYTGPVPFGRGVITGLKRYGEQTLATIEWDNPDELPQRVNTENLCRMMGGV